MHKRKRGTFPFLALVLSALLLTSCGESPAEKFSSITDAVSERGSSESVKTVADETSSPEELLRQAFDQVELPERFDGSTRYLLVNDYDGNGTLEAFGYCGIPNTESEGDFMCVYTE